MKTLKDVLEFAESSASDAIDQAAEYRDAEYAIASYRENIRDTLREYPGMAAHEAEAFKAFDARVEQLRK